MSVKHVCLISHKTCGPIWIPKTVLKSLLWRNLESALTFCKLQKKDLKSRHGDISNLPLLSVKHVCLISQKTYGPILIPKTVLKSVLWRHSEYAFFFWHFQLLCFSLCPILIIIWSRSMLNRVVGVQEHFHFSIFKRTSPPWWLCQGTTLK